MTKEQIVKSKLFSPGLIDGELMRFLLASPGEYFVKRVADDSYMKTDKGGFMKIKLEKVIDARFDYLTEHPGSLEEEKELAIQREVTRLGQELVKKAIEIQRAIAEQNSWLEDKGGIWNQILKQERPQEAILKKERAQDFFVRFPNALKFSEQLSAQMLSLDFEGLYQAIGDLSQPIAVFNHNSPVLAKLFSASAVEGTITDLQEKGALYLMAKVNVEKQYNQ